MLGCLLCLPECLSGPGWDVGLGPVGLLACVRAVTKNGGRLRASHIFYSIACLASPSAKQKSPFYTEGTVGSRCDVGLGPVPDRLEAWVRARATNFDELALLACLVAWLFGCLVVWLPGCTVTEK